MTHDIRQTATLRDFQKYIFSAGGARELRQARWLPYVGDEYYGLSERWVPPFGGPKIRQSVRSNPTMEVASWVDALWPSPPEQYNMLHAIGFSAAGSMTDTQARNALGASTGWTMVSRSAWNTGAIAVTMWRKVATHTEDNSVVFTHPASGTRELGLVLVETTGLAPDRAYRLNDIWLGGGHTSTAPGMEPNLSFYHPPDLQEDYFMDMIGVVNSGAGPAGGLFPTHTFKPIEYINGSVINGGAFWGTWTYPPVYNETPWIDGYQTTESRNVQDCLDVMPRRFSVDQDGKTKIQKVQVLDFIDFLAEATPLQPDLPNQARMFIRDNGSGKTQVCVRFNSGTILVLGTEP